MVYYRELFYSHIQGEINIHSSRVVAAFGNADRIQVFSDSDDDNKGRQTHASSKQQTETSASSATAARTSKIPVAVSRHRTRKPTIIKSTVSTMHKQNQYRIYFADLFSNCSLMPSPISSNYIALSVTVDECTNIVQAEWCTAAGRRTFDKCDWWRQRQGKRHWWRYRRDGCAR